MKYFEIHVSYDESDGYSIFVEAESKEKAVQKAVSDKLFYTEFDSEDVDYIEEITYDEYSRAVSENY